MKRIFKGCLTIIGGIVVLMIVIGLFVGGESEESTAPAPEEPKEEAKAEEPKAKDPEPEPKDEEPKEEAKEEPKEEEAPEPEPEEPEMTRAQENAVRTAQDYLDYTAFSKSGLIEQLTFEGYSKEEATFAVENVTVDWDVQAELMAVQYLDYTSYSKSGLIDQLVFEGFSKERATNAVNKVY